MTGEIMKTRNRFTRYLVLFVIIVLGAAWSFAFARETGSPTEYPNGQFLATSTWLKSHLDDPDLLVVDVRTDEHFDGRLIPGAVRLPWSKFRYNNRAANEASLFVGSARAQQILGEHGIGRTDTIVLYDSVAEDGGATASYIFLVLDMLGHEKKMILDGGIDSWIRAGNRLVSRPAELGSIFYQAPFAEIRRRSLIKGTSLYERLGDPHYQIVDVRSAEEYSGTAGTRDLRGNDLKRGHIPTALNIGYSSAWVDENTKAVKPYEELLKNFAGLDPDNSIVVYCNSGRRSSYSYFILRLMGFERVRSYEASWKEWGKPDNFFPVEKSDAIEAAGSGSAADGTKADVKSPPPAEKTAERQSSGGESDKPAGGYVSCGG